MIARRVLFEHATCVMSDIRHPRLLSESIDFHFSVFLYLSISPSVFVLDSRRKSHNRLLISFSTGSRSHASLVQSLPPISSPLQCLFCLDFIFKSCLFSEQMVYGINCPLLNKIHVEFSYKLQVRRKTTNGLSSLVYVYSLQCYAFLPRVM